jgi:hypothetical protein
MNQYIEEAVETFRLKSPRYGRAERYYEGRHDLAFATDKFRNTFGSLFREFALNLCPAICDAVRDKLRVTGFSVESDGRIGSRHVSKSTVPMGRDTESEARIVWNTNRMQLRAGEIHKEALKCGDAYAIVWPDGRGRAAIYPNRASSCSVIYDEERPGTIVRAAKYWRAGDKHVRLNLFFPDRIEKYVSKDTCEAALPEAGGFTAFGDPAAVVANPYGAVPVFHFANNTDLGLPGRSELEPAIPVQDGLNKSVLDMLVAMEYAAFRQRWAAGIEIEYDDAGNAVAPFKAGVDHIWMSQNADTRFGDFNTAELDQFLKVKDSFRVDMALITGTPLHYFTPNIAGYRSGENLKRSESRFLAKVRDRQEAFGQVWADVMRFALAVEDRGADVRLRTEWEDPAPMSERELLENILLKKQIGIAAEQALIEAGYGEADAKRMAERSGVE